MKIAAIGDLHGHLIEIPECDVLLLAGDLCPLGDHSPMYQAQWLDTAFRNWLDNIPARRVIGIAGNHDFVFQKAPQLVPDDLRWTYLQDSGVDLDGLKFWGTPWQPEFGGWAFNANEEKLARQWSLIPDSTNVLITHGPPYGYGDLVPGKITPDSEEEWPTPVHAGCQHLRQRIDNLPNLRLAVFGHIHSGYGVYPAADRTFANVSICDPFYRPTNKVPVFEIDN